MRAGWQYQLIQEALECLHPLIIVPNERKTMANVSRKGPPGNSIRVNNAQIRGRGNCTLRYKRIIWNLYWNIKHCLSFKFHQITKPVFGEPTRVSGAMRCKRQKLRLNYAKQPSEHNCAKRKDKDIFPTELHRWRKKEITYHAFNTLCI